MKLMEKLKNALFEEEYVEVEEKPVKEKKRMFHKENDKEKNIEQIKNKGRTRAKDDYPEEKPLVKKIANPVEKEDKHDMLEDFEEDRNILKGNNDFKFQEILEDDFSYQQPAPQPKPKPKPEPVYQERKPVVEQKHEEEEIPLYQGGKKEEVFGFEKDYNTMHTYDSKSNKSTFKPSPIISPIYGVLDKNYQKDEIVTKKEVRMPTFSSEKPDIDEVRNRAYGNSKPEKDLLFDVEEVGIPEEKYDYIPAEEDDLLDLTDKEQTPSVSQVTVGDAEEYFEDLGLEYNNDYIDLSKEKATGRRVSSSDKYDKDEDEDDKMIELEKSDDENLFDLIDSMYEKE